MSRHFGSEVGSVKVDRPPSPLHSYETRGESGPASVIEPSAVPEQKTMPFSVICSGNDASMPVGKASILSGSNAERKGFVCSVVSGSGGSGKSTVSTLMGIVSQYSGVRTAIIDADFQFGDQQWLLGSEGALDAVTLLRHPERVSELVAEGGIPAIICPPGRLEDSELAYSSIKQIVSLVRSSFDVVIVNTGSFWTDALLDLFELSSQVLFLVDQRPSSVRACVHALDLCIRCGLPTQQFRFALNRCGKQALLTSLDVSCALKGVEVRELREGGFVVSELLGAGLPLELVSSKNAFVEDVMTLAGELLPL
ncbi:MAG: hypothetical protein Q4F23_04985, partial [Coriobacteriia bacterium]|nr:hypothetical protein [Coriobacteriia bacterium]